MCDAFFLRYGSSWRQIHRHTKPFRFRRPCHFSGLYWHPTWRSIGMPKRQCSHQLGADLHPDNNFSITTQLETLEVDFVKKPSKSSAGNAFTLESWKETSRCGFKQLHTTLPNFHMENSAPLTMTWPGKKSLTVTRFRMTNDTFTFVLFLPKTFRTEKHPDLQDGAFSRYTDTIYKRWCQFLISTICTPLTRLGRDLRRKRTKSVCRYSWG